MTEGAHDIENSGNVSPTRLSHESAAFSDHPFAVSKNKSTGNLLRHTDQNADAARQRFSFDAGVSSGPKALKKSSRVDNENILGVSGLRRIRRQGPPLRNFTLPTDDPLFHPGSLVHSRTLPLPSPSTRSASANLLVSGPSSPAAEDLHRFPSESLHSFSFARQSEDFLHSRQNILKKSVDLMKDRFGLASNAGLAEAQARVNGDTELQGMIELLRKANVLGIDTSDSNVKGLGLGPLTGPADMYGKNPFEKSFSLPFDPVEEAVGSPLPENQTFQLQEPIASSDASPVMDPFNYPEPARRSGLKRTYTDVASMSLQVKLMEALAQPYTAGEHKVAGSLLGPGMAPASSVTENMATPSVHSHSSKWAPAPQAVFRTEKDAPWTILAANDLACLIFGVTSAEVRRLGMVEVVQEERRQWLEDKLKSPNVPQENKVPASVKATNGTSNLVGAKGGITARLLGEAPKGKPVSRAQTADGSGGYYKLRAVKNHSPTKSRGVLLCGDVVPIQKRNGTMGAASFWVMEKRGGLIWVVEEITEDVAILKLDKHGDVIEATGDVHQIWGHETLATGLSVTNYLPSISMDFVCNAATSSLHKISQIRYYTASSQGGIDIPTTVSKPVDSTKLRVSSLPHIAGMMVLDPETLKITSSNSVFSAALFGYEHPESLPMSSLILGFDKFLRFLTDEDEVDLSDGIVVPEHSFRRARALLALREGSENAANIFLRPSGLPARHRDGAEIMVDVQMRVVRSESVFPACDGVLAEQDEEIAEHNRVAVSELVYALWITYSRQLHSIGLGRPGPDYPVSKPITPPNQPSPPPTIPSPEPAGSESSSKSAESSETSLIAQRLADSFGEPLEHPPPNVPHQSDKKKSIEDFVILEEMGAGAYGQVKLARYRSKDARKMVVKYVTKKRILVDTWTRDRRLGTVPLEIHVMDYLRRDDLRHQNIVEMVDFFEDDINYYIEMLPHGIPGMDLFDYIELRSSLEEVECCSIFKQVVDAIHHLHMNAHVVHRDIKDENVVLDGEGRIKLIDFGSAAYIKNGPFDVFVGTIDYAAPEVLQGRPYGGKEQDVWALGILLYTIVYKENPFYNIDEILDHPLRVPYLPFSEECIDLIRKMLDRDLEERITIIDVMKHPWLEKS